MSTSPEVNQGALEVTRSPEELEIVERPSLPDVTAEEVSLHALKTVVLDIIGIRVDIGGEHKPAMLVFAKKNLETIAEKKGLPLDSGPIADIWQYVREGAKVKKPDFFKQKDNAPNLILDKVSAVLVQELVEIIANEKSQQVVKPVTDTTPGSELSTPTDPEIAMHPPALDKQKDYEEHREYFAQKQSLPEQTQLTPEEEREQKQAEEEARALRADIYARMRPARPVTLELLNKVEIPASLTALRAITRLPEPLVKVLAVHLGLQENPGFDTNNATALFDVVRTRAIEPAEEVAQKRKQLGRDPFLTPADRLIIEKLLPQGGPYGDTPMPYEVLLTALNEKEHPKLKGVTQDNLQQLIQDIFEKKIPRLVGLKAK